MVKTALAVVAVALAALLGYAALQPDSFRVQRTATIQAPPEKVFAFINDFNRWRAWSPWEDKDPAMKRTLGGPPAGKGATYAWEGNGDVGQGRMEIVESVVPAKVAIQLDFLKPFEAHNRAEFTLAGRGGGTDVTWTMSGPSPYITKLIGVFVSMDQLVGKDFETGLARLKAAAEKP